MRQIMLSRRYGKCSDKAEQNQTSDVGLAIVAAIDHFFEQDPADRDQRSKGVALDNHWEKVGDVQPSGEPRGDDAEVSEDFDEGFDQLETPR